MTELKELKGIHITNALKKAGFVKAREFRGKVGYAHSYRKTYRTSNGFLVENKSISYSKLATFNVTFHTRDSWPSYRPAGEEMRFETRAEALVAYGDALRAEGFDVTNHDYYLEVVGLKTESQLAGMGR